MSIYDELLKFQILPHAHEEWAEYRTAITDYILANTRPRTSIGIFGAGRCNDMDLSRLADYFSEITLLDADKSAMEYAKKQYHLTNHPGIHMEVAEFTGITADDYRSFGDELSSLLNVRGIHTDIHVLSDYALFKLEKLYQKSGNYLPDFGIRRFDYTITFGVHSQINNMAAWIWSAFASNLHKDDPAVHKRIIRANDLLIPRLNTAILTATKERAFFGCELTRTGSSDSIQGACQCIRDLKSRGQILNQSVVLWPFDVSQNILYEMLLLEVNRD